MLVRDSHDSRDSRVAKQMCGHLSNWLGLHCCVLVLRQLKMDRLVGAREFMIPHLGDIFVWNTEEWD